MTQGVHDLEDRPILAHLDMHETCANRNRRTTTANRVHLIERHPIAPGKLFHLGSGEVAVAELEKLGDVAGTDGAESMTLGVIVEASRRQALEGTRAEETQAAGLGMEIRFDLTVLRLQRCDGIDEGLLRFTGLRDLGGARRRHEVIVNNHSSILLMAAKVDPGRHKRARLSTHSCKGNECG
jgi:hypothetical protein